MITQLFCFHCGVLIEPSGSEYFHDRNPYPCVQGAVEFEATGNYGTTLWDDRDFGELLHVVICDKCLFDNAKLAFRSQTKKEQVVTSRETFDRTILREKLRLSYETVCSDCFHPYYNHCSDNCLEGLCPCTVDTFVEPEKKDVRP